MKPSGIVEAALFVDDPEKSCSFYSEVLSLPVLRRDERGCVLRAADRQILLLVRRGATSEPTVMPGGTVPSCGATGSQHLALAINREDVRAWLDRLERRRIEVNRVEWRDAGTSIYFRDPDGHLIELLVDVARLWGLDQNGSEAAAEAGAGAD